MINLHRVSNDAATDKDFETAAKQIEEALVALEGAVREFNSESSIGLAHKLFDKTIVPLSIFTKNTLVNAFTVLSTELSKLYTCFLDVLKEVHKGNTKTRLDRFSELLKESIKLLEGKTL